MPGYARNPPAMREIAFPWGLCPAQRIEMILTASGSQTSTRWPRRGRMRGGRDYDVVPSLGPL